MTLADSDQIHAQRSARKDAALFSVPPRIEFSLQTFRPTRFFGREIAFFQRIFCKVVELEGLIGFVGFIGDDQFPVAFNAPAPAQAFG